MFEKSGLHPQIKHNIPMEIQSKGITHQIWMKWMFMTKFMTYKPYNAPRSKLYTKRIDGKDQHYEMSFLVISFTAEESARLQMEHWAHGIEGNCRADIGRYV